MQKIIDDFIKHKQLTQASITQNTSNSYSNDLGNFLLFLKLRNIKKFKYIDRNLLDEYYSSDIFNVYKRQWKDKTGKVVKTFDANRSEASKSRIVSSISSLFKYLIFKDILKESPIYKRISNPRTIESQTLTKKEINQIFKYIDSKDFSEKNKHFKYHKRDRCIIETLYFCGLRVSELVQIRMSDLKLKKATPFIYIRGKGNKVREQPIPHHKNLIDYIDNERNEILNSKKCDFLFANFYNNEPKRFTRQAIDKKIKRICELALGEMNIKKDGSVKYKKISPHMFRHSIGSHMHDSGVDLIRVKEHLGHSSVSTTSRYVKSFKKKEDILEKYGPISGSEK